MILSCSTGGGHDSCAAAISGAFEEKNIYCETRDSLSFVSENFRKFMSSGHSLMYRKFPKLFKKGYGYAEEHSSFLEKDSSVYNILAKGAEKLFAAIDEGGFDTVICVHVFSGLVLREALAMHPEKRIKTAFLATDNTCSPGAEVFDYDLVFIPDESVAEEFIRRGFKREKLVVSGIPVRKEFCKKRKKDSAKAEAGIAPEHGHLLVMGGSMGCGPMEEVAEELSKVAPADLESTFICGNNRKLYKKLYEKYKNDKNIHIVGYSGQMDMLMDSADMLITKPGGITTAEAAAKGLPMILIDAVSGCEKYNLAFFEKSGCALSGKNPRELAVIAAGLFIEEEKLREMSLAAEKAAKPFAAEKIRDSLCSPDFC